MKPCCRKRVTRSRFRVSSTSLRSIPRFVDGCGGSVFFPRVDRRSNEKKVMRMENETSILAPTTAEERATIESIASS